MKNISYVRIAVIFAAVLCFNVNLKAQITNNYRTSNISDVALIDYQPTSTKIVFVANSSLASLRVFVPSNPQHIKVKILIKDEYGLVLSSRSTKSESAFNFKMDELVDGKYSLNIKTPAKEFKYEIEKNINNPKRFAVHNCDKTLNETHNDPTVATLE